MISLQNWKKCSVVVLLLLFTSCNDGGNSVLANAQPESPSVVIILAVNQGFDYYFGLPFSNDMGPGSLPTRLTFTIG